MSRCLLDPTCQLGPHSPDEHPCARQAVPHAPCSSCGQETDERGHCPTHYVVLADLPLADAKALFAGIGLGLRVAVTHQVPADGAAVTPCCGRSPLELPRSDRLTADRALVTCGPSDRRWTP